MLSRLVPNRKVFALTYLLLSPLAALAANLSGTVAEETTTPILPTITVEATRLTPLAGISTLDQQQIKKIPARNSNTSDLLKLMPGVQMPEDADSSNTAGEIAPAAVSISGGRPYDNNFQIDGVGNNSLLDPRESNSDIIGDVPGHPQELFINNSLLGAITVLHSNIPARYGGFTGGVIDIKTIDPADIRSGNISYRATSSDWTEFHINESNRDDFESSSSSKYQPEFFKQGINATIHSPINFTSGLVFNYSLLHSKIPLKNFGARETQQRSYENFFAKYQNRFEGNKTLNLSILYTPYTGDHFIKNVKDSAYQIQKGGVNLVSNFKHSGVTGESEITLAYQNSQNSRKSPNNFLSWKNTTTKSWGVSSTSREGGYGNIDKKQQSITTALHHQFNDVRLVGGIHRIAAGVEGVWADTHYNRQKDMAIYVAKLDSTVDCNGDNSDCVDNEQYFYKRAIYPKDNAIANILQIATYVEDTITIKKLTVRPGVRVSWDDYLENFNFAPRLAAGYDLHSNGKTTLIAGINRYYGGNLLTMNLAAQKIPFSKYTRGLLSSKPDPDWGAPVEGTNTFTQTSELKTPYSDEWTIGLQQVLWGGLLTLDYLERTGHDLLVTNKYDIDPDPTKVKYLKEWRNDGRSHHQEINATWSAEWSNQALTITGSWQKTQGNSESYTDRYINSDEELDELIRYNGKIGTKDELLLSDYNRPFRASIIYTAEVASRLSFTNTTTYRYSYKTAEKIGTESYEGDDIDIYEDVSNDQALIFDWKFVLAVLRKKNLNLALTLDIYNVFNEKTHLGSSDNDYELGRQIWLGASCDF
jgi:hypothetical protein